MLVSWCYILGRAFITAYLIAREVGYTAEHPGQAILLAAHDGTINAVRASFANQEMGVADLTHSAHDFVGKFTYDGKVLSFKEL